MMKCVLLFLLFVALVATFNVPVDLSLYLSYCLVEAVVIMPIASMAGPGLAALLAWYSLSPSCCGW